LLIGAEDDDDPTPEDGDLRAPLVPPVKPGTVLTAEPTATDSDDESGMFDGWLPTLSSRWIWTGIGGVLAAVAGVVGFSLTWRPRR
ncbi:MAG TPA: peptidase, partial [Micromonospora sp.]